MCDCCVMYDCSALMSTLCNICLQCFDVKAVKGMIAVLRCQRCVMYNCNALMVMMTTFNI